MQAILDLYGPTDFERFVTAEGHQQHNHDGAPEQRQRWFTEWSKTEAGIEHTAKAMQNMAVVVEQDATFRVEGVPAGAYNLNNNLQLK